jgi:predicted dithiol-disulfide oxidoreductase (DUF899 family)
MQPHKIVSREEWIAARKAHLAREKEYTLARDRLSAERRDLPSASAYSSATTPARSSTAIHALRAAST